MGHTTKDKQKLIARVRRISGQVRALEKALEEDRECSSVLQLIASCRGAISGLMSEVIEGHIRCHVVGEGEKPGSKRAQSAEELIDVLKTYLK